MSQLYKVQGARLGCWSFCNLHAELCVPLCTCWGKGYEGVTGHNPLFPLLPLARRGGSMADGSPVVRHCWRALGWSGGKWGTEIHGKAVIPSQSLPHDESCPCHWLTGPGRGSAGRKWERRDLRRKCQGSHFLIGLFLAAGDSGSVTTRWSFGGGFLRNGNVPTRTISLTVLSPVGNSYPMTSPSKLDGIYICSEVVFYFWQLPHCWLDISETRPFRFSEARKAADKTNSELSSSALLTWQCFLSTLLFPPLLILEQFWCTWK